VVVGATVMILVELGKLSRVGASIPKEGA
jgi:hypothetical protein